MAERRVLTLWTDTGRNGTDETVLRTPCREAPSPFPPETLRNIKTLVEAFLDRDDALGLAAPQIGISERIVIFRNKGFEEKTWSKREEDCDILVNPRITQARGELVKGAEGCLSCPDIQVEIGRYPEIKVRALDRQGKKLNRRYLDFLARIAQHEIDHLDGRLIVDYEGSLWYPKKKERFFEEVLGERF
jgi:peptide deformylase